VINISVIGVITAFFDEKTLVRVESYRYSNHMGQYNPMSIPAPVYMLMPDFFSYCDRFGNVMNAPSQQTDVGQRVMFVTNKREQKRMMKR